MGTLFPLKLTCILLFLVDGEWVKCDNVHVGLREKRDFMESKHFLVDAAAPMSLVIRLVIVIQGEAGVLNMEQCDANELSVHMG